MYSADGEYVEFGQTVLLEGPVEVLYSFLFEKGKHARVRVSVSVSNKLLIR